MNFLNVKQLIKFKSISFICKKLMINNEDKIREIFLEKLSYRHPTHNYFILDCKMSRRINIFFNLMDNYNFFFYVIKIFYMTNPLYIK